VIAGDHVRDCLGAGLCAQGEEFLHRQLRELGLVADRRVAKGDNGRTERELLGCVVVDQILRVSQCAEHAVCGGFVELEPACDFGQPKRLARVRGEADTSTRNQS
jgi:hypothetical protein